MKQYCYFLCLSFALLILSACDKTVLPPVSALKPEIYKIETKDIIHIKVFGEDELSAKYQVDDHGQISFPYIGSIQIRDLSLRQTEHLIEQQLEGDYLKVPHVTATLIKAKPIYILGEVNNPGRYDYSENISVLNAVAIAGGFTHRAKKEYFEVIRDQNSYAGKADTLISPNDTIIVKERFF